MEYIGPVLSGVIAGLVCKAYYTARMQNKIKCYEDDIIKSREKVFELEELNKKLENRLKDMEAFFSKDRISMN